MSVGKSYGYIFLHLSTNESILISSFFFFPIGFFPCVSFYPAFLINCQHLTGLISTEAYLIGNFDTAT